jgi:hypothetical protein
VPESGRQIGDRGRAARNEAMSAKQSRSARWLAAARRGDARAQFALGDRRVGGVRWLKRAAEQGHVEAQGELGWYYHSDARPKRRDLAVLWWRRAAEQGDAETANCLGELLRDGEGVRRDHREAFRWFLASAKAGDAVGQLNVGVALFDGLGVKRNRAAALRWYRRAARQGEASALFNIGHMHFTGAGVARSRARARIWLARAAALGHVVAAQWLAQMGSGSEGGPALRRRLRARRRGG